MLDLVVAARLDNEEPEDPPAWAAALAAGQPEEERQRLADFIARLIAERAPLWRRLGAVAAPPRAAG
jgi:hypothetical protein